MIGNTNKLRGNLLVLVLLDLRSNFKSLALLGTEVVLQSHYIFYIYFQLIQDSKTTTETVPNSDATRNMEPTKSTS